MIKINKNGIVYEFETIAELVAFEKATAQATKTEVPAFKTSKYTDRTTTPQAKPAQWDYRTIPIQREEPVREESLPTNILFLLNAIKRTRKPKSIKELCKLSKVPYDYYKIIGYLHDRNFLEKHSISTLTSGQRTKYYFIYPGVREDKLKGQIHKLSQETKERGSNRMKFIHERLKKFMAENPALSYEDAFRRASFEYKNKVSTTQPTAPVYKRAESSGQDMTLKNLESLGWHSIDKDAVLILKGIIHNMVRYNTSLNFQADAYPLGLQNNPTGWSEFIAEFMIKADKISQAFNIKNNFIRIMSQDGDQKIRYKQ